MKGETGLKLFKKTCWLLGFLPAVIGGGLIWHIWDNMRMTSMLTDILAITAVGILAGGPDGFGGRRAAGGFPVSVRKGPRAAPAGPIVTPFLRINPDSSKP